MMPCQKAKMGWDGSGGPAGVLGGVCRPSRRDGCCREG